jgi:CHAT domain-containing protein
MSGHSFRQAEAAFARGDFKGARDIYGAYLLEHIATDHEFTTDFITALERMADIAVLFGEWERAENFLAKILEAFQKSGDLYGADYVSLRSALIASARGQFPFAKQILRHLYARPQGLPSELEREFQDEDFDCWESAWRWPKADSVNRSIFFASLYLTSGRISAGAGQYERATLLMKRGLAHVRYNQTTRGAEVPLVLSLSAAYLERGDLLSASLTLDLLPGTISAAHQPGYAVEEFEIRAKIDLLRGDLGPAKAKLERVLEICRGGGFDHAYAQAALKLAYVLIFLNQTERAAQLCAEVRNVNDYDAAIQARVEFLERFAAERGQSLISSVAISYSVTEMQEGSAGLRVRPRTSKADQPFNLPPSPNFLTLFEERALRFYWYIGRCDWQVSRSYLREMELTFAKSDPPTDSLIIHQRLAALNCMLAYYEEDFTGARDGFLKVIEIVRRLGFKPELWQLLRFLHWCHARLGNVSEAEKAAREAHSINRTLADTLSGSDRAIYELNKWTEEETYLAAKLNELARMKKAVQATRGPARLFNSWGWLKIATRLAALLDQADRYKADATARTEEEGATLRPVTSPKLTALLRLLRHPRNRYTISFLVLPDRVLIARAGWLSLDFAITGVTRIQLRELMSEYHRAVQADERGRASGALKILSEALQLPSLLQRLPRRTRALTFVPDDVLHGLPFAAIKYEDAEGLGCQTPAARKYLIENYAVSLSYEWHPKERAATKAGDALMVSVPYGATELDPLPGAEDERRHVLKWLTSVGINLIKVHAPDKREILGRLPEARFFHIACHGEFCADTPSESALLIVSPGGEVERLSLRELSHLNLSAMEMAVLSSCWAADNFILPGRWVISLSETFWRAGARSVLGSLWSLYDEVVVQFMNELYDSLAAGMPRDTALQCAQLACVNGRFGSEFRDPVYWAGIVLYGETAPVCFNGSAPLKGSPAQDSYEPGCNVASGSANTV